MSNTAIEFWAAYDRRDLKTLREIANNPEKRWPQSSICFEVAACTAILMRDAELVQSLDFPVRAVMQRVADKPSELRFLLDLLGDRLAHMDIPSYVREKTTPETRKILREYGKK